MTLLSRVLAAPSIFHEASIGRLFMIAQTPVKQSANTELYCARLQGMCHLIGSFCVQLCPAIDILDSPLR
jgi:hypothetical protein